MERGVLERKLLELRRLVLICLGHSFHISLGASSTDSW